MQIREPGSRWWWWWWCGKGKTNERDRSSNKAASLLISFVVEELQQQQVVKLTDVIELDIQTRISFPIAERPAFVCVCAERAGSGLFCVALLFAT
jgi:hypothetical protein